MVGYAPELFRIKNLDSLGLGAIFDDFVRAVRVVGPKLNALVAEERGKAKEEIKRLHDGCIKSNEYLGASVEAKEALETAFSKIESEINSGVVVSSIRDGVRRFANEIYPKLFADLSAGNNGGGVKAGNYVQLFALKVDKPKPTLETDEDIDRYLDALGTTLRAELLKGNRVLV